MKTGDRVFVHSYDGVVQSNGTITGRVDDDIFCVIIDGHDYILRMYTDELTPITKLHKLLAGEEDA
jgi:hypothetical protein